MDTTTRSPGPLARTAVRRSPRWMIAGTLALLAGLVDAAQIVVDGPPGSGEFGKIVTTLPNGNIVVTDPLFDVPGVQDTIRFGAVGKYYRVSGTGLERLETVGLLYYRPGSPWIGQSGTPWFAAQLGTNVIDPLHELDFSWVLVLGLDFRVL